MVWAKSLDIHEPVFEIDWECLFRKGGIWYGREGEEDEEKQARGYRTSSIERVDRLSIETRNQWISKLMKLNRPSGLVVG